MIIANSKLRAMLAIYHCPKRARGMSVIYSRLVMNIGGFRGGAESPFFLVFSKRFCTTPTLLTAFRVLLYLYNQVEVKVSFEGGVGDSAPSF